MQRQVLTTLHLGAGHSPGMLKMIFRSRPDPSSSKVYLVGGGIASMAAAALLIRDGDFLGHNITIFEELETPGGSLDASGNAKDGYVLRGGRMIESKYLCTFDLFSSIPTLDDSQTVTQEIFAWNETVKTSSKSRLVRDGRRQIAPKFALSESHILTVERLSLEPESMLGGTSIADHFDRAFFKTDFWVMWCTTFAFQPWHSAVEFKRYLLRFTHMVDGFSRLNGVMRTVYNQYDSMVRPLRKWLDAHGVVFEMNTAVTDVSFIGEAGGWSADRITYKRGEAAGDFELTPGDIVFVTLGSMTEASALGGMHRAPELLGKSDSGAWSLWERLAQQRPEFGNPAAFTGHVDQSKWISFTTTLYNPELLHLVRDFTGDAPGEGGLITFPESNWLVSIVIPHQPHFIGQRDDVSVFWGYGLSVDAPGNFVQKPMSACTGEEIMTEVLGHLQMRAAAERILHTCTCIPCMMPFITSQFLVREEGDRPEVRPKGYDNLAFVGQYCELADDVVFTVEYSIRSAQAAVYSLLESPRKPPAVYKGQFNPRVLLSAFRALHDISA